MIKYIILLIISLNALSAIESNKQITAAEINEKINELYQLNYTSGVVVSYIYSPTKVNVPSRTLTFTKKYNSTKLLLLYGDVFRVYPEAKMCTIYLEIDGNPCSNGQIYKSIYTHTSYDINALEIEGVCEGITSGTHTYKIKSKANNHSELGETFKGGTCEFSWDSNSSFLMTIKEVN